MYPHSKALPINLTLIGVTLIIVLAICHVYLKRPRIRDLIIIICVYLALCLIYLGTYLLRRFQNRRTRNVTETPNATAEAPPISYPTYADYRNSLLPPLRPLPETRIPITPTEELVPPSYNSAINEPAPSYRSASNLSIQLPQNP
ncbi:hypothetical protein K493DRAFT_311261 [Basidiobolus meristosporus CBS 931.73]|uniref:Uncharacterized protein n=1 Tax=Basidiobolus meristosporus CBS 931.73 TaxID=1314790 RepID=A0A1Y1Z3C9_9FUNG|nr:hypothetical protein K493DRAFT_311261 [Basidiobolus meristosporus CBS 931.73]|eukprot:ORY04719.1 hypothetical protein K493DRAFT_311261 [Basidiobolus meristosporus CBS 931.73]